jgi:23S rRNA pseudouridine1911/1915/1917 synthase
VKRTYEAEPGRLDAVVARLSGEPRADVQRAIADGLVEVDGVARTKSHRLHGGELVTVDLAPERPLTPEGPPVPVRYEDDAIAVIVKPAGVVTHPTAGQGSSTASTSARRGCSWSRRPTRRTRSSASDSGPTRSSGGT